MGQTVWFVLDMSGVLLGTVVLGLFFYMVARCTTYSQRLEFWWLERRRRIDHPGPTAPTIQDLAADVRRLRRSLMVVSPTAPVVKQRGLYLAYDQVLVAAADVLEVPHQLENLPLGPDRDVERLELEAELEQAGLVLTAYPPAA